MSLVVARCLGSMVYIVSDTFLTDARREDPRSLLQGVIKTRVMTDELAISFAGLIVWIEDAFRELDRQSPLTAESVLDTLLRVHRGSAGEAEFVLATASPPGLIQIKDGAATATSAAWLGSHPAFQRFQGYATGALPAPPGLPNSFAFDIQRVPERADRQPLDEGSVQAFNTMVRAMRLVIEDAECPGVGGFVVPVGLHKGRFTFMDYAAVVTHPLRFDLLPTSFVVPFGSAEEGGHAINLMSDLASSANGLALFALQGRCGAAFVPNDGLLRPTIFRDKSPIEFEEALAAQLGLKMASFYGQPAEYCARAMRRLHDGDRQGALEEAGRAVARSDKDPAGFDCRGIVLAALGRLPEAIEDFDRTLEMKADNFRAWANRGLARGRNGDLKGAMADFDHAITLNPTYAFAYRMRALGWRALGDVVKARRDAETADSLDPPKGGNPPVAP